MESIQLKAYTNNAEQILAIKSFLKALKIKFEISQDNAPEYNDDFVKKINKGDADLKAGAGKEISIETLTALCK